MDEIKTTDSFHIVQEMTKGARRRIQGYVALHVVTFLLIVFSDRIPLATVPKWTLLIGLLIANVSKFVFSLIKSQKNRKTEIINPDLVEPTLENLEGLLDTSALIGDDPENSVAFSLIHVLNTIPAVELRECPQNIARKLINKANTQIDYALQKDIRHLFNAADPNTRKNKIIMDFHIAVLRAVSEMDRPDALATMKKVAAYSIESKGKWMLRDAAAARLPEMEARFETIRLGNTLVRPSYAPTEGDHLLRPAGVDDQDQQLLLRPSTIDPS
ncbi:MAG: hypothetical protein ABJA67_09590 [Chthonomonadales bacterium]